LTSLPPAALEHVRRVSQRSSDGSDLSELLVLNLPDDDSSDVMTLSKQDAIQLSTPERLFLEAREESIVDAALEPCSDV
jgi:hypothetical protein